MKRSGMTRQRPSRARTGTGTGRAVDGTRADSDHASESFKRTVGATDRFVSSTSSTRRSTGLGRQRRLRAQRACERRWCLQVAVGVASAKTVVAAWVSRARRGVEAVRESCAQNPKTVAPGGRT